MSAGRSTGRAFRAQMTPAQRAARAAARHARSRARFGMRVEPAPAVFVGFFSRRIGKGWSESEAHAEYLSAARADMAMGG